MGTSFQSPIPTKVQRQSEAICKFRLLNCDRDFFFFQNPELQARLEKLRAQQANKEYQEMTKNVDLNVSVSNMVTILFRRRA